MKPEILNTLRAYHLGVFIADLLAGFTVAMVAIPLSLAIAIASGADPATGLVTAIVGGFVISLLGGSRVQIGGPTGAFIVVVYGVIAAHGYGGLVTATFMAGVILLVAGLLRVGNLIAYVPQAVVHGFTIGIAIIIAASQIKDFLGLDLAQVPADFIAKIQALWQVRATFNLSAFVVGLSTICLIVMFRRAAPKLPGLIVAVGLTSGAVYVFDLPVDTIAGRFGALPSHLPRPALPDLRLGSLQELLPSAVIIAFLAGVESLLSARVADGMTGGRHRPNAEVLAQGAANLASSVMGGLPATGAIARTATNISAGGRTPVAGLIHAATILAVMMIAAPLAGHLALPALAGLLLVTAWNMSEPHKWAGHRAMARSDQALLLMTLVLCVLSDLTIAIGLGVAVGLALRLRRRNVPPANWQQPDR